VDPDLDPHQSDMLDPDPHQSDKLDPDLDPYQSDNGIILQMKNQNVWNTSLIEHFSRCIRIKVMRILNSYLLATAVREPVPEFAVQLVSAMTAELITTYKVPIYQCCGSGSTGSA
jgi:hypothetical protein